MKGFVFDIISNFNIFHGYLNNHVVDMIISIII